MRYEPQGLERWANTDLSLHVNGPEVPLSYRHEPCWWHVWIYCLMNHDEESAHLIRMRNDPDYAEQCAQEAAKAFPAISPGLRSFSECESERKESEEAA